MKMTIIIPTRDRASTLRYTLLTCTAQGYRDLEIIVSDNCSNDDTEAVVRSVNDPRVRYLRTPRRLSMSANFEYALSYVTEGFVGFIGDDDGMLPDAIERAVSFLAGNNVKTLTSVLAFYRWPCAPDSIRNSGSLQFCPTGDTIRDSAEYIDMTLKGTGSFYIHDLPSLYYGFADVSLTRPRGGQFFNSVTPDAYSAFAIAAQVANFGYLGAPLFIVGASGRSNGVSAFVEDARKEESKKFILENDIPFHKKYLQCNSLAVSVHESFAQAYERYPELAKMANADPYDGLRYMAREVTAINRDELMASAIHFAGSMGIECAEVKRIFKRRYVTLNKIEVSLRKRLCRDTGRKTITSQYQKLQTVGVENAFQAALFFQNEVRRMKGGGR